MTATVHADRNADAARRWIADRLRWERFLDEARLGRVPAAASTVDDVAERPAA